MRLAWPVAGGTIGAICLLAVHAEAFSIAYDQESKSTYGKNVVKDVVTVTHVIMKDEQSRMEQTVQGQTTITIRNAQGTFQYTPAQHMAIKQLAPPATGNDSTVTATLKQQGATFLRSETLNGYPCDVYQLSKSSQMTQTVWIWRERGKEFLFQVQIVIQSPSVMSTTRMSNIQLDVAAPDSLFQLPAGVEAKDMGRGMEKSVPGTEGIR